MTKLAFCLALTLLAGASSYKLDGPSPITQVVKLLTDLQGKIEKEGQNEQNSFNTYSCWCEDTLANKAHAISENKDTISEMETLIKKLKAEIASHGAEIDQLNKDIAQNKEAVRDATELRNKERADYDEENKESLQCVGALETAIKVLTGAGTKSFLQGSLHEAELLSVVAGVRTALNHKVSTKTLSNNDIEVMKHFVSRPDDFVGTPAHGVSAAQVGHNPFGDYAPQSTQIQGILKGMLDAFNEDITKDNEEEHSAENAFTDLMNTKKQERDTLTATLENQETDKAEKNKRLADSKVLRDAAADNVEADEEFFEDAKQGCKDKAKEWSERQRLRIEELNGIVQGLALLKSEQGTLDRTVVKSFLQLASVTTELSVRAQAYNRLKNLSGHFRSRNMALSVAALAVQVKTGDGPFDKVMSAIDVMIAKLRQEEQEDIEHRDRCDNDRQQNRNAEQDIQRQKDKAGEEKGRMARIHDNLRNKREILVEKDLRATNQELESLNDTRNGNQEAFKEQLANDLKSVQVLKQTIVFLSQFYKNNRMAVPQLLQQHRDEPPSTWSSGYGGSRSESGGILAIIEMLAEDSEKGIAENRKANADDKAQSEETVNALLKVKEAQEEEAADLKQQIADVESKLGTLDGELQDADDDLNQESDTKKAVAADCNWVEEHFDNRRKARKAEMSGLNDAKSFLAGMAAGNEPLM